MIRTSVLALIAVMFTVNGYSQGIQAFEIYNAKGKKVSYKKMLKKLSKEDITLFGEYHNNSIVHWLQLELTKDMGEDHELILGAEMFEQDNQVSLSDYVQGRIDDAALDSLARLWPNYYTDYKPLVDYAKANNLEFIATNIPRRFANRVYHYGFETLDSLSMQEKQWVAPLPIAYDAELPGYKAMIEMMGNHGTETLPMAQASKDATMAHFILSYYTPERQVEGAKFIHYNGSYHSNNYEGINWYLKRERPDVNIGTIATVTQENVKKLLDENKGLADFIICVDEDVTVTH